MYVKYIVYFTEWMLIILLNLLRPLFNIFLDSLGQRCYFYPTSSKNTYKNWIVVELTCTKCFKFMLFTNREQDEDVLLSIYGNVMEKVTEISFLGVKLDDKFS